MNGLRSARWNPRAAGRRPRRADRRFTGCIYRPVKQWRQASSIRTLDCTRTIR
jgi:hypothetical protein